MRKRSSIHPEKKIMAMPQTPLTICTIVSKGGRVAFRFNEPLTTRSQGITWRPHERYTIRPLQDSALLQALAAYLLTKKSGVTSIEACMYTLSIDYRLSRRVADITALVLLACSTVSDIVMAVNQQGQPIEQPEEVPIP